MFEGQFTIKIDTSHTYQLEGVANLENNNVYDTWRFKDISLESGKIYGLVGEYGIGPMYLSYFLGGRIEFDNLRVFCNDVELSKEMLRQVSWNLEPHREKYKNALVKKSIQKALDKTGRKEDFEVVADKFILTEPRYDRKLCQLSGERWRASAALGYANGKKIFFAPHKSSNFYYQMCQSCLLKALRELTADGAIVLLPVGSDDVMKHIADECIYLNPEYDIAALKERYAELCGKEEWIV